MWLGIVSLFPELVRQVADTGVVGRAVRGDIVRLHVFNPRDFTSDRHQTVDDRPYGGGPGMVMMVEPLLAALEAARSQARADALRADSRWCALGPVRIGVVGRGVSRSGYRRQEVVRDAFGPGAASSARPSAGRVR